MEQEKMVKKSLADFMKSNDMLTVEKENAEETPFVDSVIKKEIDVSTQSTNDDLITDFDASEIKIEAKSSKYGIIPELSKEDKEEILASMNNVVGTHEKLIDVYVKILLNDGYSQKDIDAMPIVKLQHLGRIISDTRRDLLKELASKGFNKDEVKSLPTKKLEDLLTGNATTKAEVIPVTPTVEKEEVAKPEVQIDNENPEPEPTLDEVLSKSKNVSIKYSDKPLNSYRRGVLNKTRKLLERQKRGRSVEIFLPNSNLKLRMFELHQSNIIQEIITMEVSKSMTIKRKSMTLLLERSEVIASNGSEISTDGLLASISVSDIPYIQLGAAVVNAVDTIPYVTRCRKCGTPNLIDLKVNTLLTKALNEIPAEVIAEYREEDAFEKQIEKATTNLTAQVVDKSAYCVIDIANASIMDHILIGETGKSYIVSKFQELIPNNLENGLLDYKYDFLLNLASPEIIKNISALLIAQYIKSIKFYKFETKEGTEWNDDVNFDFEFTLNDPLDVLIDGILGLETSTFDIMEKLIEEKFIKASLSISTGPWKCSNDKCKEVQESDVSGLELLMSSLQNKMLSDM